MTVLGWLTGGLFNSLMQLLQSIGSWILGFFTSLGAFFVNLIIDILNGINGVLPDPTPLLQTIQNMFNLVQPYVGYVVDLSFISAPVMIYFVGSWIFRILARRNTYFIKLITGWIQRLIP